MKGCRRLAAAMACVAIAGGEALAQTRIVVTDRGPGRAGRLLEEVIARPHDIVDPDTGWYVLPRGARVSRTLIVLGRTTAIAGTVEGDVVVVGGDLFVRPAARITGRAVAIGGAVYQSTLADVGRQSESYRDDTFAITPSPGGYSLEYRSLVSYESQPLLFPGIYGLRLPTYDRVNGASLPFGPSLSFAGGRGIADLVVKYRSDLGKLDPFLDVDVQLSRRLRLEFHGGRGSFSNDEWIWSDFVNSFSALGSGIDTRNQYRADRAELRLHRLWEFTTWRAEPFLGGLAERAWSVGPVVGGTGGPWSLFGRVDSLGMMRPNPPIMPGRITSALAGGRLDWEAADLVLEAGVRGELAFATPTDDRFTQVTTDLEVVFTTFGEQEYEIEVHWVTTPQGAPPPQRFVYAGGSGTLPFLDLLEQGGDELLLVDQRYSIPILDMRVGILGIPTLLLRHRIGSAGLSRLPDLEQMIGVGVLLTIVRAEVQIEPVDRKIRASVGFSFSR